MRRLAVCGTVIALVASLAPPADVATAREPQPGGTMRIGLYPPFGFTDAFDPTGEYLGFAWDLYGNLLLRTLVTYRHVEGPEGNVPVPDLATDLPEPTDGGRTYTFHLKEGVMFGPPVQREVTSADVEYAFERIADPKLAAQYGFYYGDLIEGWRAFANGRADDISGIETPDDRTIVFHLTKPAGDFLMRVAMPATAPIPREVARCFGMAGRYGRYVISSGPYMIEGSEDLVIDEGCRRMKPISGYDPGQRIVFTRNPYYDPTTDSPEIRESFPDKFSFELFDGNVGRLFRLVEHARLESAIYEPGRRRIRRYQTDPDLQATVRSSPLDRTWYLTMNLTQAPFDDLHVRKAVNLVVDKAALRDAWGGEVAGRIATHILPPDMTGGHPTSGEYDPYASRDFGGDPIAAREEMKLSPYDSDHDGRCDAKVCRDVIALSRNYSPWDRFDAGLADDFRRIGIHLDVKERYDFYTPIQTISRNVPIAFGPGWGKDYPDGETFMPSLFGRTGLRCSGNTNYSLIGATKRTKRRCGAKGDFSNLPSVEEDIKRCESTPAGEDRTACWIDLDKRLMERIVPWVPYLWDNQVRLVGPSVSRYEFDQFSGDLAFAHMAVDESRQRGN
jgi:peptide/nickel transport system substrate-binding protein